MPLGKVLYTSGRALPYVYFPTTCIVSLVYVMENGSSAEIAVTGFDGLLGISLFLGGQTAPNQAVVQSGGHAYRIRPKALKTEFEQGGSLQHLLLLYTQALIAQMAQTAVCNRHHTLDQQLCRWLLLSLDRLRSGELVMTQELIANMLGVRRQGVVVAARNLQRAGLINYQARAYQRRRSPRAGNARLRVLRGRQARVRPLAARLRVRPTASRSGAARFSRIRDVFSPARRAARARALRGCADAASPSAHTDRSE